jgi:tol-pal system protein YbgF
MFKNPLFLSQLSGGFMSLKKFIDYPLGLRHSLLIIITLTAFLLIGCGSSEEATTDQPPPEEAKPLGSGEEAKPKEEKPMDQALTSFVGGEDEKPVETQKPVSGSPTQLAQYEKQIEDLRTENTGLKQKIVKLEQENRGINARMTEVEARYTSEKTRADKAEELLKSGVAPVASATKPAVTEQPKVISSEVKPTSVSMSTYEDALKAFNSRKYDDAARSFKAIIEAGANDDLTNRANYWLGESYFAKKNYKDALPLFQDALKFKNSEKKADAQFMIAQTYERLGNKVKAKEAYEKVVKDYPMSKNVKRAKERWAKL